MKRRMLSLILALALSMGLLCANVSAAQSGVGTASDLAAAQERLDGGESSEGNGETTEAAQSDCEPEGPETEQDAPANEAPEAQLSAHATDSGTCGSSLTWTLDGSGTLTISGSGDMTNYAYPLKAPWEDYRSDIQTVVLGDGVTSIGDSAFSDCKNLNSVDIPRAVVRIGANAFFRCESLTALSLPNVRDIGAQAFGYCTALESVELPEYSMDSIGESAFWGCEKLKSITLPADLSKIESYTFYGCTSLKSVKIPYSVGVIDSGAFKNCTGLSSLTIGSGVEEIESSAFANCTSLKSVTIPGNVTYLWGNVFENCDSLKSVKLSNGLEWIGSWTFAGCDSLKSVTIPQSVTYIGTQALGYDYYEDEDDLWDEEDMEDWLYSDFSITGYLGTEADTYAAENGIHFKAQDKTNLSSVKWDKKKKMVTVKWKKNNNGSGYQVQFSNKKNFSKVSKKITVKNAGTASITISGVPKGTHYVRVRAMNGKHYAKWSSVKSVKVN